MDFQNKTVIVTGSSSGIGAGAVKHFVSKGANVVLASRNTEANETLASEMANHAGSTHVVTTDVANEVDIKNLMNETISRFGSLDVAINNAGIEGTPLDRTADYSTKVWDEVIGVNLSSVFLSMKYEIREMLNNELGGCIVNISSLAGLKGGDAGVAYHASKFGVVGATKAAAFEYASSGIRINAICPAVIETPMAERAFTDPMRRSNAEKGHPIGRFGQVSEVVQAIDWLASENSKFVTGIAVPIDGGAGI